MGKIDKTTRRQGDTLTTRLSQQQQPGLSLSPGTNSVVQAIDKHVTITRAGAINAHPGEIEKFPKATQLDSSRFGQEIKKMVNNIFMSRVQKLPANCCHLALVLSNR